MLKNIVEGQLAPDFDLEAVGTAQVNLADYKGRYVALFCYPKADTSGCTQESLDFAALFEGFTSQNCAVIGMSPDPVKKQDKFRLKYDLPYALACDPAHEVLKAYGVWVEKSMYGRKYMGVERSTFLIGPDQRIVKIWRKLSVSRHAQEVLNTLQNHTDLA